MGEGGEDIVEIRYRIARRGRQGGGGKILWKSGIGLLGANFVSF